MCWVGGQVNNFKIELRFKFLLLKTREDGYYPVFCKWWQSAGEEVVIIPAGQGKKNQLSFSQESQLGQNENQGQIYEGQVILLSQRGSLT